MLILVRHAHAGDKRLWPFGDVDRPLSSRGQQQAEGLARQLGGLPVTRLVTSPYRRCRQTLAPLSEVLDLEPELSALLAPDAGLDEAEEMLLDTGADGSLFCTHGELLNGLLRRWRADARVEVPAAPDTTAKGGSWIVERSGGRAVAHYLKPLRVVDLRGAEGAQAAAQ
ncbi:histidine phosphatase superfamily protein (branch 1) [Motilibacter rhizosphaerae]|uniref:Histidine phosphatase superfamily protein (Branch 1) n=1 Tax=Motilibacter rhizosphaerae TaxID=598652 RepID=A0A4Q7NTC2_9ACTN|nr:phosphoglycerate mutase family protein [Motilibacter rhizosphaerae]RZS89632.1 histidine phosphatase superfamily protein (branch 1) [Motilibacter rhizosphaerae]